MKHLNYKSGHGTHIPSFYRFRVSVHNYEINDVLLYNKQTKTKSLIGS